MVGPQERFRTDRPLTMGRATRHTRFGVLTIPVSRPLSKNVGTMAALEGFDVPGRAKQSATNTRNSNCGEVAERSKAHASKACVPIGYRGFESHPLRSSYAMLYL